MSSQQHQLRAALADPCERVACSTSAGFRALLSSSPTSAIARVPSPSAADADNAGISGEFFPRGDSGLVAGSTASGTPGPPSHDIFVATPEVLSKICRGAIGGGIKFCPLGQDSCTYSTHAKKVQVMENHAYIKAGLKAAYTQHHLDTSLFGVAELQTLLQEMRSLDEWVHLFHSFNGLPDSTPVSSVVTPKKHKQQYWDGDPQAEPTLEELSTLISSLMASQSETEDFENLIQSKDFHIMWEKMLSMVQLMDRRLKSLQVDVGADVDQVEETLHSLSAVIGRKPTSQGSDDSLFSCPTLWDGLMFLQRALAYLTPLAHNIQAQAQALEVKVTATDRTCSRQDSILSQFQATLQTFGVQLGDLIDMLLF